LGAAVDGTRSFLLKGNRAQSSASEGSVLLEGNRAQGWASEPAAPSVSSALASELAANHCDCRSSRSSLLWFFRAFCISAMRRSARLRLTTRYTSTASTASEKELPSNNHVHGAGGRAATLTAPVSGGSTLGSEGTAGA
jgi:hypothetical protein